MPATSPVTRAALWCVRVVLAFGLGLAFLGAATPARADAADCSSLGDPACRSLKPVLECVWREANGSQTAVWGYLNPTTRTLHVPVGNRNSFSPGAPDQAQPQEFRPGGMRNAFTTPYTTSSLQWRLTNSTARADSHSPACTTKPVPAVGSMEALLLGLLMLLLATLTAYSARRRPRMVPA